MNKEFEMISLIQQVQNVRRKKSKHPRKDSELSIKKSTSITKQKHGNKYNLSK